MAEIQTMSRRQIADALDDCLERILFDGEDIQCCLKDYSEMSAELGALLQTAKVTKDQLILIRPNLELRFNTK